MEGSRLALITCRLCGGGSLYLFYRQGNDGRFRFYRCRSCRYVNYDMSTGLDQGKYSVDLPSPLDHCGASNRSQTATFEYIRRLIPQPGRMLDIGCGNGRLLLLAREAGWKVEGVETDSDLASRVSASTGAVVHTGRLPGGMPRLDCRFDLVILRHVIEHIPDPAAAVLEIRSLLSDGGLALFEFPNIDSPGIRLKLAARRLGLHRKTWRKDYVPGHCGEFGRRSFRFLMDRCGMELQHWETYSSSRPGSILLGVLPMGSKARALASPQVRET